MATSDATGKKTPKTLLDRFDHCITKAAVGKTIPPTEKHLMNTKACGKLIKESGLGALSTMCDASVFPKCKVSGKSYVDCEKDGEKFVQGLGKEYHKLHKGKKTEVTEAEAIEKVTSQIMGIKLEPESKKVDAVTSRLTDAKGYTGAHKQRFDEEGKGKGAVGRTDKVENTGYTGQYKGKDTYGQKK